MAAVLMLKKRQILSTKCSYTTILNQIITFQANKENVT